MITLIWDKSWVFVARVFVCVNVQLSVQMLTFVFKHLGRAIHVVFLQASISCCQSAVEREYSCTFGKVYRLSTKQSIGLIVNEPSLYNEMCILFWLAKHSELNLGSRSPHQDNVLWTKDDSAGGWHSMTALRSCYVLWLIRSVSVFELYSLWWHCKRQLFLARYGLTSTIRWCVWQLLWVYIQWWCWSDVGFRV